MEVTLSETISETFTWLLYLRLHQLLDLKSSETRKSTLIHIFSVAILSEYLNVLDSWCAASQEKGHLLAWVAGLVRLLAWVARCLLICFLKPNLVAAEAKMLGCLNGRTHSRRHLVSFLFWENLVEARLKPNSLIAKTDSFHNDHQCLKASMLRQTLRLLNFGEICRPRFFGRYWEN